MSAILVLAAFSFGGGGAIAAQQTPGGAAAASGKDTAGQELLDEVEVRGTRLWELRAAIVKAEQRLVARYNELNQVDDFRIECVVDTPTGTRISRRGCKTKLQMRIEQQDASAFTDYLKDQDVQNGASPPVPEAGVQLLERYADYQKNMVKLLTEHPDLRVLAKERGDAVRRYDTERRKRLKGQLISFK